jgi:hypothetical protein
MPAAFSSHRPTSVSPHHERPPARIVERESAASRVLGADRRVNEIACEDAARRLWDYLDGRSPEMSREEMDAHLEHCAGCSRFVEFARVMRVGLSSLRDGTRVEAESDFTDLEARVRDHVRERLRVALADSKSLPSR